MSKKAESSIRTSIANFIRKEGGYATITSGSIKTAGGTPDILSSLQAHMQDRWIHHAVEVKTSTGTPDLRQLVVLRMMGRRGYLPMVVDNVRDFHEIHKLYSRIIMRQPDITHMVALHMLAGQVKDEYNLWRS